MKICHIFMTLLLVITIHFAVYRYDYDMVYISLGSGKSVVKCSSKYESIVGGLLIHAFRLFDFEKSALYGFRPASGCLVHLFSFRRLQKRG